MAEEGSAPPSPRSRIRLRGIRIPSHPRAKTVRLEGVMECNQANMKRASDGQLPKNSQKD